jgi:hypothetical protein
VPEDEPWAVIAKGAYQTDGSSVADTPELTHVLRRLFEARIDAVNSPEPLSWEVPPDTWRVAVSRSEAQRAKRLLSNTRELLPYLLPDPTAELLPNDVGLFAVADSVGDSGADEILAAMKNEGIDVTGIGGLSTSWLVEGRDFERARAALLALNCSKFYVYRDRYEHLRLPFPPYSR